MATLEKVMQLKSQGYADSQIIDILKEEGVSPREINELLSQAKIKDALDNNPEEELITDESSMRQSIMPSEGMPQRYNNYPEPAQEYVPEEQGEYYQDPPGQESYPVYSPQGGSDVETINEVCEQIIEEKTEPIKKDLINLKRFKEESSFQIEKMNERLTKIETTIDDLQMALLRKVGIYGEDIKNLAQEMYATQESFSKLIDPLTDNIRELQKINSKDKKESDNEKKDASDDKEDRKSVKKQKSEFEDYLR
ncbi:MAG: hypothetical protein Q8N99_05575 [Nanoarchaeota archaeon]|nr:hypothetical protein [Nanoarchaeota archaeon]